MQLYLDPFLNIGTTSDCFQALGNVASDRDALKMRYNGADRRLISCHSSNENRNELERKLFERLCTQRYRKELVSSHLIGCLSSLVRVAAIFFVFERANYTKTKKNKRLYW